MTAKSGFSLIPIGAKVAAALVFLAIVAGLNWFFVDRNFRAGVAFSPRTTLNRARTPVPRGSRTVGEMGR